MGAEDIYGPRDDDLVAVELGFDDAAVLAGYRRGRFPMWLGRGVLGWFEPTWRALLVLEGDLSHTLHRSVLRWLPRREVSIDTAFEALVALAADPRRPGAWIDERFYRFYRHAHEQGIAHSVECWEDGRLVGGCFGLVLGRCFVGESMVSIERDASKVAFLGLLVAARRAGITLIDGQWVTPHLVFLGFRQVERRRARAILRPALSAPAVQLPPGPLGLDRDAVRSVLVGGAGG